MSSDVWSLAGLPNYADVSPPAIRRVYDIEGVGAVVDAGDDVLNWPDPADGGVSSVCYVFVSTLWIGLSYTCNLRVSDVKISKCMLHNRVRTS
jgi:hypothetical protein